jgi:hypothetical protein
VAVAFTGAGIGAEVAGGAIGMGAVAGVAATVAGAAGAQTGSCQLLESVGTSGIRSIPQYRLGQRRRDPPHEVELSRVIGQMLRLVCQGFGGGADGVGVRGARIPRRCGKQRKPNDQRARRSARSPHDGPKFCPLTH